MKMLKLFGEAIVVMILDIATGIIRFLTIVFTFIVWFKDFVKATVKSLR